jgi:Peptidase family M28
VSLADAGPRPAGSAAERSAHLRVRRVFKNAGLSLASDHFSVPGGGRSRNIIGIRDTPADCLTVLMAHTDSTDFSPGALDNASGVGVLVELAPRLARIEPECDVWLVATGAEERVTGEQPEHAGAAALVRRVIRQRRAADVQLALSLDEVGRGARLDVVSNVTTARPLVERAINDAARGTGLDVRTVADLGEGASDNREFQIRGMPAARLGVPDNPVRHTPRDTRRNLTAATFPRVRRLLEALVG